LLENYKSAKIRVCGRLARRVEGDIADFNLKSAYLKQILKRTMNDELILSFEF
jgi:hypothetical protein